MQYRLDIERVVTRLRALGLSKAAASRRASPAGSPDLIRDHERNPEQGMRLETAERLAEVLECDLAYLRKVQSEVRLTATAPARTGALIDLDDIELQIIAELRAAPAHKAATLSFVRTLRGNDATDERGRSIKAPSSKSG